MKLIGSLTKAFIGEPLFQHKHPNKASLKLYRRKHEIIFLGLSVPGPNSMREKDESFQSTFISITLASGRPESLMFTQFVHKSHWIQENSRWVASLPWSKIDRLIKKRFKTIQILLTSLLCFSIVGIEGDIYYIRDGQVKLNAVNFNMTVPSRVDRLRFIWYSKRIPSKPMVSNLAA